ncbi:MAG TPA: GAF domain-containing sensor histidine kinase [Terriglobales bacterium]|nr:GAF domain-containing sensor histidine kinase [Terriglobales bacterium]
MKSATPTGSHSGSSLYPEDILLAAHRHLMAEEAELLAQWRRAFRPKPRPSGRVLYALEQLLLPHPYGEHATSRPGMEAIWEQVHYVAARLAKLSIPLAQVNDAAAQFRPLAIAVLTPALGTRNAAGVYTWLQQRTSLAVAEAYVAAQSNGLGALVRVLDAELNSGDLPELLQRLLQQAAQLFPLKWGEILLIENRRDGERRLRHAASYGLEREMIHEAAGVGPFFERVVKRGTPGFLLDAANDPRVAQPYYRALEVKSVWAVPLTRRQAPNGARRPENNGAAHAYEVLGVLTVAFDRVYECLPQEKELLRALAERSTLAIERTRMAERLQKQQQRVMDLSRRLLEAQDEERRRISRDLHDETGQSLLALRLYMEMGLRQPTRAAAQHWMEQGLTLVDSSVAELRRILSQLSPLLLDELGLEAALRLELRKLRSQQNWKVRFQFVSGPKRLERSLETLVYRVVMEGLRNAARHAQATRIHLKIVATAQQLQIRLSDDGVGLSDRPRPGATVASTHFGLAGMRERVRLAGGRLGFDSERGQGLRISIQIPLLPVQAGKPEKMAHAS